MLQGPDIGDVVLLTKQFSPPLQVNQITPSFSKSHVRDPAIITPAEVEQSWADLKAKREKILFDGTKFRLHGSSYDTESGKLTLDLGVTSFKEHVGTGVLGAALAHSDKFADKTSYSEIAPSLAQPLGCETLLVTADKKAVFFKRSLAVAEFSGYHCGPGGHPEPQHCFLPATGADHSAAELTAMAAAKFAEPPQGTGGGILFNKELFHSPILEIQQEVGLDPKSCTNVGLLAIVGSYPSLMKPVALFHVVTSHTSAELAEIWKTHKHKEETEGNLLFWSYADVVKYVTGKGHSEFRFTPTARVSVAYTASILGEDLCITDLSPTIKRPCDPSELKCVLGAKFNRQPCALDHRIPEVWDAKTKKSKYLFNALKFRLGGVVMSEDGQCTVEIGMTDYREYVSTNLLPVCEWVAAKIDPEAHVSQALGVEALLISSDDQIVLFKRSVHVADFPGFYACPGGHPEPQEIYKALELPFDVSGTKHDENVAALQGHKDKVLAEFTRSILMEVSEEIGVPPEDVVMEGFCGLARNELNLGKPDLLYRIRTKRTSAELTKLHRDNVAEDSFESEGALAFFPLKKAQGGELPPVALAPPALACIRLCAK